MNTLTKPNLNRLSFVAKISSAGSMRLARAVSCLVVFSLLNLLPTISLAQQYFVDATSTRDCSSGGSSDGTSESECVYISTTVSGGGTNIDRTGTYTITGYPRTLNWRYDYFDCSDRCDIAECTWEFEAFDQTSLNNNYQTGTWNARDPAATEEQCCDSSTPRCQTTTSSENGPTVNYTIKPIVSVLNNADFTGGNFCEDDVIRLNATAGFGSNYRWYYSTVAAPSTAAHWTRISGETGSSLNITIGQFGVYNTAIQIGVAVGTCSQCTPNNMHANSFASGFRVYPPPPPINSAVGNAPICPGGTGSVTVYHSNSAVTGTPFVYTVTQYVSQTSGACGQDGYPGTVALSCDALPSTNNYIGDDYNCAAGSADEFCSGFIGNFTATLDGTRTVTLDENTTVTRTGGVNELNLYPGIYVLEIEASGSPACVETFYVSIPESSYSDATLGGFTQTGDPSCKGGSDGALEITLNSGLNNYDWALKVGSDTISSGLSTSNTFETGTELTFGQTYYLAVTDRCKAFADLGDLSLSDDGDLLNTQISTDPADCLDGTPDGRITGSAIDVPGKSYSFTLKSSGGTTIAGPVGTGGTSNYTFNGYGPLDYYVRVDATGCDPDSSVVSSLLGPTALTMTVAPADVNCSNANDGQINAFSISKIRGDYNFSYELTKSGDAGFSITGTRTNADSFNISNILDEGTYTLTITDNCFSDNVTSYPDLVIIKPTGVELDDIGSEVLNCFDDSVQIDITWDTGIGINYNGGPYSINIEKNGALIQHASGITVLPFTTQHLFVDNTHSYDVTVTDVCGVTSAIKSFTVTSAATSNVTATLDPLEYSNGLHLTCPENDDGRLEVRVSGGVPLSTGSKNYTVELRNNVTSALISSSPSDCDSGNNRDCFQFNGLAEGITYRVVVTDDNGCTRNFVQTPLTVPVALNLQAVVNGDFGNMELFGGDRYVQCKGDEDITLTANISDGNPPYRVDLFKKANDTDPWPGTAFQFEDGVADGTADFSGLGVGWYKIEVTDQQNCDYTIRTFRIREADTELLATNIRAETIFSHGANTTCYGDSDGGIVIDASGGVGQYTYQLTGETPVQKPGASHTFTGLPAIDGAGDTIAYTIALTDEIGCDWTALNISNEFKLAPPDTVEFSWSVISSNDQSAGLEILCRGDTATVRFTSEGGKFPHQVTISGGGLVSDIVRPITDDDMDNFGFVDIELPAGVYNAALEDELFCTAPDQTVTLDEPATHVVIAAGTLVPPVCIGGDDGQIPVSAVDGVQNDAVANEEYTFRIRPVGAPAFDAEELKGTAVTFLRPASNDGFSSQDYEIVVFDKYDCTDTVFVTMNPNPNPLTTTINDQTPPSCYGGTDGSITLTASNYDLIGGNSLIYSISGGHYGSSVVDSTHNVSSFGATLTFENLEGTDIAGAPYEVWIEDANGCPDTAFQYQPNLNLIAPAPLAITLIEDIRPSCYTGSDGSLMVQASGGVPPYTISFDNGSFVTITDPGGFFFVNNLEEGTYNYRLRDDNYVASQPTCEEMVNFTVQPGRFISFNTTIDHVSCKDEADGEIDLSVSIDNRAPGEAFESSRLSLFWVYNNAASDTISTNEDIAGVDAGNYTIKARYDLDSTVCVNEADFTLLEPDMAFGFSDTVVYDASCGNTTGSILFSVMGGWPDSVSFYNLDNTGWQNLEGGTAFLTGIAVGDHSLQVAQSDFSCTDLVNFSIDAASVAIVLDEVVSPICIGGSNGVVRLSSDQEGVAYAIDGGSFENNGGVFTGLAAGTYQFQAQKITETSCVSEVLEVTVTDPPNNDGCDAPLSVSLLSTVSATCEVATDGAATVLAVGGIEPYQYFIDGSAGSDFNEGLAVGDHVVVVEDAVGSTDSVSFSIDFIEAMSVEVFTTSASCPGICDGTIDLLVSGGSGDYNISWDHGDSGASLANLCPGTYIYTISDALNGSCTLSGSVTVNQFEDLSVALDASSAPTCFDGTDGQVSVIASGGSGSFSYAWEEGTTGHELTDVVPGLYQVTVTDQVLGCSVSGTFEIPNTPAIEVVDTTIVSPSCFGGDDGSITIQLENTTSPRITWSNGQLGATASGLVAGTYTFEVLDALGCTLSGTVVVPDREQLQVAVSSDDPLCFGDCTGSIALDITGGTAPYFVAWDHGPRSVNLQNLCVDTYAFQVSDVFGCTFTGSVDITSPDELIISLEEAIMPSCYQEANGSISVVVAGGTPDYTYSWSNGGDAALVENISAGDYSLALTDQNGCDAAFDYELGEPEPLLTVGDYTVDPSCPQSADGQVFIFPQGGTAPYIFAWSDGGTDQNRSGLAAGTYSVEVFDQGGCSYSRSYTLSPPNGLEIINVSLTDPLCFNDTNGSISFAVSGGVEPYTFSWESGQTTQNIEGLAAGTYTVTVSDDNGCDLTTSFILNNPTQSTITGITESLVLCEGGVGNLEPDTDWAAYAWTGPDGFTADTKRIEVTDQGEYTLVAFDDLGCPSAPHTTFVEVGDNIMEADILRISEAIAFEPIVFVDISLPVPENTEWLIPDDPNIVIQNQNVGNIEIVFTAPGVYEIGLRANIGNCESEVFKTVTVTTAEDEESGGRTDKGKAKEPTVEVTAFPNPAKDKISFKVNAPTRDVVDLVLLSNIDHRKMQHERVAGSKDYLVQWDIKNLKAGVYILYIQYKDTTSSKRIVVR